MSGNYTKIDIRDKKIIRALCTDARMSVASISRSTRMPRDSVSYRIKRLEKAGIVVGYKALIDDFLLGYENTHIFLMCTIIAPNTEKKIIDAISSYGYVKTIIKYEGRFNYEIAISSLSSMDFDSKLSIVIDLFGKFLISYETLPLIKRYHFAALPNGFFIKNEGNVKFARDTNFGIKGVRESKKDSISLLDKKRMFTLDEKDKKILSAFSLNARSSLLELSKASGFSIDIVNYRLKILKRNGVIQKAIPAFNYSRLGYSVFCVMMKVMPLSKPLQAMLGELFSTSGSIIWASKSTSSYNTLFYIASESIHDVHKEIDRIRLHLGAFVTTYEILIMDKQFKYTYLPF